VKNILDQLFNDNRIGGYKESQSIAENTYETLQIKEAFCPSSTNPIVMSNGIWTGLYVQSLLIVLLGLSILLTAFLGGCIWLRNRDRAVHPALKYASIAVLVAVISIAGLAIIELFDEGIAMAGLFAVLVLIPLAVVGAYLQQRSHLTPVNLLSTTALSWGPSFIIGAFILIGVIAGIGIELDLAQTTGQQEILRLLAVVLGGVTVVLSGVSLSSWINPLMSSETPS
jgi:hypothetical protein